MISSLLGRAALVAACAGVPAGKSALPASSLAIRDGVRWSVWWNSDRAPISYSRYERVASVVHWQRGATGVEWAEAELAGSGEAYRTRLILVRLDPRALQLSLDTATDGMRAAWRIARAPSNAVAAFNAGQFTRHMPWGWVVLDGHRVLPASIAPLATAISIQRDGSVTFTHAAVPDSAGVRWAFQSYPTLLNAGTVPEPIRQEGCGVDVSHRDARVALGALPDGRLLVAMTRFDGLGRALERVPFGLTTPEMAAVMGALGVTDAVLLDGGISAQLMLRDGANAMHSWPGLRDVPLAFVARPRADTR